MGMINPNLIAEHAVEHRKRAHLIGLSVVSGSLCLVLSAAIALAQTKGTARDQAAQTGGTKEDSPAREQVTQRPATTVREVRLLKDGGTLVAAIELDGQAEYSSFTLPDPSRIIVDIREASNAVPPVIPVGRGNIERIRVSQRKGDVVRVVFDMFDTTARQHYWIEPEGKRILVHFGARPKVRAEASKSGAVSPPPANKMAEPRAAQMPVSVPAVKMPDELKTRPSKLSANTKPVPPASPLSSPQPKSPESMGEKQKQAAASTVTPAQAAPKASPTPATAEEAARLKENLVPANNPIQPVTAASKSQPVAPPQPVEKTAQPSSLPGLPPASPPKSEPQPKAAHNPAQVNERRAAAAKTSAEASSTPDTVAKMSEEKKSSSLSARESQPSTSSSSPAAPAPLPARPARAFTASDYTRPDFIGEPIKLDLKNVDIREVLRFVADTYKVNFVIDKSVAPEVPVTVSLEDVPWNQALDALLRSNRLGLQVEGNILRVMTQDAIAEEDNSRRKQMEARQQAAPLVTEMVRLNYAKALSGAGASSGAGAQIGAASSLGGGIGGGAMQSGLDAVIRSRLSPRGTIQPDPRTNTLVITDIPENIAIIKDIIRQLDVPEPQVEIEARIVIANRSFARDLGVQLAGVALNTGRGGLGSFSTLPGGAASSGSGGGSGGGGSNGSGGSSSGGTAGPVPFGIPGGLVGSVPPLDSLRAAGASTVLGLTTGIFGTAQISLLLSAAESKGNVKTISTPRITAQNNQTANVVNGIQIPVQTQSNNTVTTTFVTAALKLEITPQITDAGTVVLHVVAENNSVNLAIATSAAPGINTQRAETTVLVPDGGTTIIGGINVDTELNRQERTPGLSRIPGLGELFKRRVNSRSTDEILFFITPRIYRPLGTPVPGQGSPR